MAKTKRTDAEILAALEAMGACLRDPAGGRMVGKTKHGEAAIKAALKVLGIARVGLFEGMNSENAAQHRRDAFHVVDPED